MWGALCIPPVRIKATAHIVVTQLQQQLYYKESYLYTA
jgi:hypothetical protein